MTSSLPPLSWQNSPIVPYSGFEPSAEKIRLFTAAIAPGANATVPGPAAGYVRFFDCIIYTADAIGATMATVTTTIQPANVLITGTQSGTVTAAFTTPPPLAPGESFRVANGGANPISICAYYWDEPVGNRVHVRTTITGGPAFATLIPAAPAGKVGRFCFGRRWNGIANLGATSFSHTYNADTISHSLQIYRGAGTALLGRGSPSAAGTGIFSSGLLLAYADSTSALTGKLAEAVSTTAPNFYGLYEYVAAPT